MIVIFWVFCITIFSEKSKRKKTNVGNKTTLLLMMVINWSKKLYISSLLPRAGRKDVFFKKKH